jgi:hypothetical protein
MISDPTGVWRWVGWLAYIPALAYIAVTGAILHYDERKNNEDKHDDSGKKSSDGAK